MSYVSRALFLLLLFAAPVALFGQVTTTSIVGTVTDPTGAAIADATVVATDTDRGQSKSAQTGSNGAYRIDFLLTGNYTVTVSMPGFKRFVQKGITLNAGAPASVDIALSAGEVTESIEVTASAPLVNTVNAEVGTTVDSRQMIELPLVNRNPYQLLDLTPGVQTNSNIQSFGAPAQITLINGGSDNGAGSVNYYLDGAPNMTGLRNSGNILPNPDALQEFRVQTSNYGAPYGRFASGIINALVKTGTNTVHGTVFEFIRNQKLNARDWGSNATLPKSPLHRNQFGATLGGPIVPNKTFFFGSYAGLRQTSGTFLQNSIIPTAANQAGNLSDHFPASLSSSSTYSCASGSAPVLSAADLASGKYLICNPYSSSSAASRTTYPGNIIPAAHLDPVATRFMQSYLPAPNSTFSSSVGTYPSWQGYYNSPYNTDDFLLKLNHTLSANQQLSATYFNSSGFNGARGGSSNVPYSSQNMFWRQQNFVLAHTWTITPAIVNNAWISYTRLLSNRVNTPTLSLADFGSAFTPQGPKALPNLSITGYFTLGQTNSGPGFTNNYAVRDLVTWTLGRHTLQFGGEAVLDKSQKVANLNNWGSFTFNGGVTRVGSQSTGLAGFGDFLLGLPSSAQQDAPASVSAVTLTSSFFLQDDLRLNRQLTVNLGLRYDIQTPPVDPANRESSFVAGQQSTVRPNAPVGLLFPGDAGISRGITPVRYSHFSPRLGLAYDPFANGKTAFRGGAGLFWGSLSEESWMASGNTIPFAIRYSFPVVSSTTGASLSNPYRGQPSGNIFPYNGNFFPVAGPIQPTSKSADSPYTVQMNLSVQQQLTNSWGISLAYVGALSRNQVYAPDLNYPGLNTNYGLAAGSSGCTTGATGTPTLTATTGNVQCRRPYQPFGTILRTESNQSSSYHSLQATVTQRMSHHLSVSGTYVWSKSLSSVGLESSGPGGTAQNYTRLRDERGRTDNDYRQMSTIGIVWQPDYYTGPQRWLKAITNGWEISPLARLRSGSPFTVMNSLDANLDGQTNDRASVVGDPNAVQRSLSQWFNASAFVQNAVPTNGVPVNGNTPRNFLTGPAYHNVDLNLARTFPITERVKFQFRAEASNALNNPSYSNPGGTIGTATFGRITGAGTVRQLQFGGKLSF